MYSILVFVYSSEGEGMEAHAAMFGLLCSVECTHSVWVKLSTLALALEADLSIIYDTARRRDVCIADTRCEGTIILYSVDCGVRAARATRLIRKQSQKLEIDTYPNGYAHNKYATYIYIYCKLHVRVHTCIC